MAMVQVDLRRLATIATIGLLIGLGYALWQAGEENLPPPSNVQTLDRGVAQGRHAEFASWEFTYDSATTLSDQVTQEIDGIHDGVYWQPGQKHEGTPFIRMRADKVVYNSMSHDFRVDGPAHFDIDDHGKMRTFDTDLAIWSDTTQILRIPGNAWISGADGGRLTVSDITVDVRSGQYTIGKIEGSAVP
jgi:hypothetical protein